MKARFAADRVLGEGEGHPADPRSSVGQMVGRIEFFPHGRLLGAPSSSSYQLYDEAHTSRGYTTEAVPLLVDYLFGAQKKHRVQLVIVPENAASRRIAEKCGFIHEGRIRGAFFNDAAQPRRGPVRTAAHRPAALARTSPWTQRSHPPAHPLPRLEHRERHRHDHRGRRHDRWKTTLPRPSARRRRRARLARVADGRDAGRQHEHDEVTSTTLITSFTSTHQYAHEPVLRPSPAARPWRA